ncbi:2-methylbutanal oxime monooxygenase [Quercus suber]|uniref:2-methylbutanal oxime monooxygenase n=1 Tax=Quercus suber TaxID=58331 RepID=A0AAW0LTU2_QUESU
MEGGKLKELNEEAMQILHDFDCGHSSMARGIVDAIMGLPRRSEKCYHRFDSLFKRLLDEHLDPARPKLEQKDIVDVMLKILKDEKLISFQQKKHIKAVLFIKPWSCFPLFF